MKASIVISTVVLASLTPLTWAEERDVFEGALANATGTKGNNLVTGSLYANAQKDAADELVRAGAELRSQSELLAAPIREGLSHEVVRPGGVAELRSQSELLAAPIREGLSHEVVRPGAAELRSQSELLAAPIREGLSHEVVRPGGAAELRSQSELLAAPTREGLSHEAVRPGGAAELRSQSELLAAPTKEGVSDVARPGPSQSKDAAGE